MTPEEREALVKRLEDEIVPLMNETPEDGGYDCCGCSTYRQILHHAIRIVRGTP